MTSSRAEDFYSHLVDQDDEDLTHNDVIIRNVRPTLTSRLSGPGFYRLATVVLGALCVILLLSVIAVAAHYKSKPEGGAAATSQKQLQDVNVTALAATIGALRREKAELLKEKEELQRRLDATKAPEVKKPTAPPVVCATDWNLFNNSCYFISVRSMSWPNSQAFCQREGGHLAIIHTAEEQTFLWDLLPRGHWNAYWFGLTDGETEDEWKWVDGTPMVGGFWEEGEPNNHINEDCGYIIKTLVLTRVAIRSWYDAPCSMSRPFICEKEMLPPPAG